MFSNDNNIETIAQLIEAVKRYVGLKTEYIRLDVTEKTVRVLKVLILILLTSALLLFVVCLLSVALAYAIAPYMGNALAFLCVAGLHLLLYTIMFFNRKKLVERPLARFLASLILK